MTPSLKSLPDMNNQIAVSLRVNPGNTFESFEREPGTTQVLSAFRQVLDGPRFMLLEYGGVGNGKTHLLHASALELYQKGLFTRVLVFSEILSMLRASINNPERDYDYILNNYCHADRVIIDDIGAGGSDSEYGDRILESIVCTRYNRNLLTLMATNRDITTLPERVLSRLQDKSTSFLVQNKGGDYRSRKNNG